MSDYFYCPHCDARVPAGATACPECGSDESTGWSEEASYGGWVPAEDDEMGDSWSSSPWLKYLVTGVSAMILTGLLVDSIGPAGLWIVPLLAAAAGLAYYWTEIRPARDSIQEKRLYEFLLRRARGDEALVERLVDYERQRSPGASTLELLRDAIARWERDAR